LRFETDFYLTLLSTKESAMTTSSLLMFIPIFFNSISPALFLQGQWHVVCHIAHSTTTKDDDIDSFDFDADMILQFDKDHIIAIYGDRKIKCDYVITPDNSIDLIVDGDVFMRGIFAIKSSYLYISLSNDAQAKRPVKFSLRQNEQGIIFKAKRVTDKNKK
jgi:hypothetical protein